MILKRLPLLLLALLLPLLLLNCSNSGNASSGAAPNPVEVIKPVPSTGASRYTIKYDIAFKRWGEFYFPFDDWKWWKAQGIAESDLNPKAVSWAGAQGVMQIMPNTGAGLGLKNPWDAEESIQMGVKYDNQIDKYFKDIKQPERRKCMFAGYNAGMGNINKARRLVNSDEWVNIAVTLPLITGRANSAETTGYVTRIHKLKEIL